jgi:hypothetical protein
VRKPREVGAKATGSHAMFAAEGRGAAPYESLQHSPRHRDCPRTIAGVVLPMPRAQGLIHREGFEVEEAKMLAYLLGSLYESETSTDSRLATAMHRQVAWASKIWALVSNRCHPTDARARPADQPFSLSERARFGIDARCSALMT